MSGGATITTIDRFAAALAELGGVVRQVGGADEAAAAIAEVAARQDATELAYAPFDLAAELDLESRLQRLRVALVDAGTAGRGVAGLSVGLTGATMAVAETGTLVVGGRPGAWGLVSVLPWIHVAVLRAGAVVDDLTTAWARFLPALESDERDWVWITGPSRSADIGHTLVLGAHGPNSLVAVVVDDDAGRREGTSSRHIAADEAGARPGGQARGNADSDGGDRAPEGD